MAARKKQVTGEKAKPRYRAPQFTPTESAEFQRFLRKQLGAIQADLDGLHDQTDKAAQVRAVATATGALQAIAGDTLRIDPPAAGIRVLLPEARAANKGQDVTILVLGALGPVLVRAVNSAVQGAVSVTLSGRGLRVLRSDGDGGWWIVGQSSADASNALVALSAGTNIISSGTAVFSNSNGVTFGANTAGVITASVSTGIGLTGPGSTTTVTGVQFSNQNNMSWTIVAGSGVVGRPFVIVRGGRDFVASTGGTSSALSFLDIQNANNVSWGLSTTTNNIATLTASVTVAATRELGLISHIGGNSVVSASRLAFSNASNVTFSLSTAASAATLIASVAAQTQFVLSNSNGLTFGTNVSTVTASFSTLSFSNANNVTLGLAGSTLTASASFPAQTQFVLSASNGISFGTAGSTVTASYTVPSVVGLLSAINFSAGTTSNNLSALTFSNLNGVTFGLNGSVVTASVGAGGAAGSISAGTTSVALGQAVFSNSNNVSFGLAGSTVTASVTVASTQGSINLSAGTTSALASAFTFGNANLVSFGLNAGTITASISRGISGVSAGTLGLGGALSGLSFSDANGMSFGLSTNAGTASAGFVTASAPPQIGVIAIPLTTQTNVTQFGIANSPTITWRATTAANAISIAGDVFASSLGLVSHVGGNSVSAVSRLAFSNSNNVTWSLSTGVAAVTVFASVPPTIGLVSHIGGNSASDVTRLAFSNASNVTFSLSTAANAVTVLASVNAAAAGGIAIADEFGNTRSTGTVLFPAGTNSTATNLWSVNPRSNNMAFGLNGATMTGNAFLAFDDNTAGNASIATRLNFVTGGNVTFVVATGNDTIGARQINVSANAPGPPTVSVWRNLSENDIAFQGMTNLASFCSVFPLGFQGPFPGNMTLNTLEILAGAPSIVTSSSASQWAITYRGGIYSLNNSTQLTLLNSFSTVFSSTSIASVNVASYNNLYSGFRWVTVGTGAWSSSPVLAYGVQYWMALVASQTGSNIGPQQLAIQRFPGILPGGMDGIMSSSQNTGRAVGLYPFLGQVNTGNIPSTIGTAGLITSTGLQMLMFPVVQFRNGVALGN